MVLYHYIHCPFCIRVRLTLGLLGILNYQSRVLRYDDEQTPVQLSGEKMLPIFEFADKSRSNESLLIIQKLDTNNKLNSLEVVNNYSTNIAPLLKTIGENVHSLAMPYWAWTPEFDPDSRKYFQTKKELKRGSFKNLIKNQKNYIEQLNIILKDVENKLEPFYSSKSITLHDILIVSHLLGMYTVHEFQFSEKIHSYIQTVTKNCNFSYARSFWEEI